jgi:hypothetical protein
VYVSLEIEDEIQRLDVLEKEKVNAKNVLMDSLFLLKTSQKVEMPHTNVVKYVLPFQRL